MIYQPVLLHWENEERAITAFARMIAAELGHQLSAEVIKTLWTAPAYGQLYTAMLLHQSAQRSIQSLEAQGARPADVNSYVAQMRAMYLDCCTAYYGPNIL